jgi:hypothetical protein
MTDPKHEGESDESADEAALAEDLEIKDGEEADAIKGGAAFKIDTIKTDG